MPSSAASPRPPWDRQDEAQSLLPCVGPHVSEGGFFEPPW